jgi:DNA-binding MarR family transcriptional regulator
MKLFDKTFQSNIDETAGKMKEQYNDLRIDTFLSFMNTSEVFGRYSDLKLQNKTITRAGYTVLNTIILYGGAMFPTDISKKIFRSKHSVSRAIITLEKHGLVTIGPIGDDRRRRRVKITPRGLAFAKKGNIASREHVARAILNILNDEETKHLNQILKTLREHTLTLMGINI